MKSGQTLIRLARHKVETVQALAAAAERARDDMVRRVQEIDAVAGRERARAESDPALAGDWAAYAAVLKAQRANLDRSLAAVEAERAALADALAEAFESLKRFELLEERRHARLLERRLKRAQAILDEAAREQVRRRALAG